MPGVSNDMSANNNPNQFQFKLQHQIYSAYLQYCQMSGLNPQNQDEYDAFVQMWKNIQNQNTNQGVNNDYNYNFNFPNNNMNNNQNNTQNTQNQNQDAVYIHDNDDPNKPKEVFPRDEKTIYVNQNELKGNNIPFQNAQNSMPSFTQFQNFADSNIITVILTVSTGFKVFIPAPKDMTFEELFINFANKASIPVSAIGEQVVFLYNAEKLAPKSKNPLSSLIQTSIANITVLDQGGING